MNAYWFGNEDANVQTIVLKTEDFPNVVLKQTDPTSELLALDSTIQQCKTQCPIELYDAFALAIETATSSNDAFGKFFKLFADFQTYNAQACQA